MIEMFFAAIIGVVTGSIGYFVATFWMRPILRFGDIRQQIASDLVFFANAITPEGLNEEMKKRVVDRRIANRRSSADLMACLLTIPCWYRWLINFQKQDPFVAAQQLIGLSNTVDYDNSDKRINIIKEKLNIP